MATILIDMGIFKLECLPNQLSQTPNDERKRQNKKGEKSIRGEVTSTDIP